jgi:galactonate dehydratase
MAQPSAVIAAIDTWRWSEQPNCLWVEITTSDGLTGLGETYYNAGATEAIVHEMLSPLMIGTDPGAINLHARNFFACANFSGYAGAEMRAYSAVDIALWDLLGQSLGRPVHALLGGAVRDRIGVYNTCADAGTHADQRASLEAPGDLAEELLERGITAMKVWPWDRFAPQILGKYVTGPAGR